MRNRAFRDAYTAARAALAAGLREAIFPAGTYWLRRFTAVTCAPASYHASGIWPSLSLALNSGGAPSSTSMHRLGGRGFLAPLLPASSRRHAGDRAT